MICLPPTYSSTKYSVGEGQADQVKKVGIQAALLTDLQSRLEMQIWTASFSCFTHVRVAKAHTDTPLPDVPSNSHDGDS